MKKSIIFFMLACVSSIIFSKTALAATASIDKSSVAKGLVVVKVADTGGKKILVTVEKGGGKYAYTIAKSPSNIPLQMGTGDYKIMVLENSGGNNYKPLVTETVKAASINEAEMYKASIPLVDYGSSKTAIPAFKTVTSGKSAVPDKVSAVYDNVVKNYAYDMDKAKKVKEDYVPVIDDMYKAKKGICYDYAALVGGALRSQGIPTKLVMGYVPEISSYHAWNEVLISGEWVSVDATYDAQVVKAGKTYTMKKDKSKTKVVKVY